MKKSVVLYSPLDDDLLALLRENFDLHYFPQGPKEDFYSALATAQGLLGFGGARPRIDQAFLDKAPQLQVISTISVGYDHCDLAALNARKIVLANTPGVLTDTTADTIFALLMATARRVVELDAMVRQGQWRGPVGKPHYGADVHHKTTGILGLGRIGAAVAKRAHLGFDMQVLYTSHSPKPEAEKLYRARRCPMDELLAQADYVVVTLPLTPETNKIINAQKLALMKPEAMLINGARGAIVDEPALIEALRNKTIKAAGLDVFTMEPLPADSPLISMSNVVLLPHVGSASVETRYAMARLGVENLIAAMAGRLKQNCVNPEALTA